MHSANLLPLAFTERSEQRRTASSWIKVILCLVTVTLFVILWGQSQAAQSRQAMERAKAAATANDSITAQHARLQSVMRSLNQYEKKQREQRSPYSPLVALQLLHQLKSAFGEELQAQTLEFHDQTLAVSTDKSKHGELSLQLVAHGTANCSKAMQHIRDTGFFTDVKLSSSLELIDNASNALKFTVRCEF